MLSKKNSGNRLLKKPSKTDLCNIDMHHLYHKLSDNFMVENEEEAKFELEDTKHLAYQRQKK